MKKNLLILLFCSIIFKVTLAQTSFKQLNFVGRFDDQRLTLSSNENDQSLESSFEILLNQEYIKCYNDFYNDTITFYFSSAEFGSGLMEFNDDKKWPKKGTLVAKAIITNGGQNNTQQVDTAIVNPSPSSKVLRIIYINPTIEKWIPSGSISNEFLLESQY